MTLAQTLQRRHLAQVIPYASARRSITQSGLWLNANEAPNTPSSMAASEALNRYPSFQSNALNSAYAGYAEVQPEQVLSCRGSDEAIDLLIRSFCEPGQDAIMITSPTYGMYAISAQTHGAQVIDVPLQPAQEGRMELDIAAMETALKQHSVKLIFVCNPSNPLGSCVSLAAIRALLKTVGEQALVIIDEAYIEYAAASTAQPLNTTTQWLADYPQLVILRTLSKAFGLAAIRCGFALADPSILEVLRKVIAPYPLPQPTIDRACTALSATGVAAMQLAVATTVQVRQRVSTELATKPWVLRSWPSVTNFILLQVENAEQIVAQCAQQCVLIRNQSQQFKGIQAVRISIGSPSEMQRLMEVLP